MREQSTQRLSCVDFFGYFLVRYKKVTSFLFLCHPLSAPDFARSTSPDRWYGVTYAADKPVVMDALHGMQEAGLYPDGLWG